MTTPDGAKVVTHFDGQRTLVTDQSGKQRLSKTDAMGRLTKVWEVRPTDAGTGTESISFLQYQDVPAVAAGYRTAYTYDALSNLRKVEQGSQWRYFACDSLKRLLRTRNPEQDTLGTLQLPAAILSALSDDNNSWSLKYYYGENSNLTRRTDVRAISTYYTYDALNRVTFKNYFDAMPSVSYSFDGYTDASGFHLIVNARGQLTQVRSEGAGGVNVYNYTARGSVAALRLGNGLWEHTDYNNRLQPERIRLGTSGAQSSILQLDYGYGGISNNSNLIGHAITVPASGGQMGLVATQVYTYDALNRLESAREVSGSAENWKQTYAYDSYGNRTLNVSQTTLLKLTAPGQTERLEVARPSVQATNRVTEDQDGDGLKEYIYDKAGNMTCEARYCGAATTLPYYEYDAENRLTKAGGGPSAGGSSYAYDGDGRRVKKVVGSVTTVFVYDVAGKLIAEYGGGQTQDRLGSTRVVTGEMGEVRGRYDYAPFGEELSASRSGQGGSSIRRKYTGKERDDKIGLDYFGAKYYSKGIKLTVRGELTSCGSTILPGYITNPQSWNHYIYVRNDPPMLADPDRKGRCGVSPISVTNNSSSSSVRILVKVDVRDDQSRVFFYARRRPHARPDGRRGRFAAKHPLPRLHDPAAQAAGFVLDPLTGSGVLIYARRLGIQTGWC